MRGEGERSEVRQMERGESGMRQEISTREDWNEREQNRMKWKRGQERRVRCKTGKEGD